MIPGSPGDPSFTLLSRQNSCVNQKWGEWKRIIAYKGDVGLVETDNFLRNRKSILRRKTRTVTD